MPPQQRQRFSDLVDDRLNFRAHGWFLLQRWGDDEML
jgi:hypothetical protein